MFRVMHPKVWLLNYTPDYAVVQSGIKWIPDAEAHRRPALACCPGLATSGRGPQQGDITVDPMSVPAPRTGANAGPVDLALSRRLRGHGCYGQPECWWRCEFASQRPQLQEESVQVNVVQGELRLLQIDCCRLKTADERLDEFAFRAGCFAGEKQLDTVPRRKLGMLRTEQLEEFAGSAKCRIRESSAGSVPIAAARRRIVPRPCCCRTWAIRTRG